MRFPISPQGQQYNQKLVRPHLTAAERREPLARRSVLDKTRGGVGAPRKRDWRSRRAGTVASCFGETGTTPGDCESAAVPTSAG